MTLLSDNHIRNELVINHITITIYKLILRLSMTQRYLKAWKRTILFASSKLDEKTSSMETHSTQDPLLEVLSAPEIKTLEVYQGGTTVGNVITNHPLDQNWLESLETLGSLTIVNPSKVRVSCFSIHNALQVMQLIQFLDYRNAGLLEPLKS